MVAFICCQVSYQSLRFEYEIIAQNYQAEADCITLGFIVFIVDFAAGKSYCIGGCPKDNSWAWSDFTDLDFTS